MVTIGFSHLQLDAGGEEVSDQGVVSFFEFQTESFLECFLLLFKASDLSPQRRDLQHHPATEAGCLSHAEKTPKHLFFSSARLS